MWRQAAASIGSAENQPNRARGATRRACDFCRVERCAVATGERQSSGDPGQALAQVNGHAKIVTGVISVFMKALFDMGEDPK